MTILQELIEKGKQLVGDGKLDEANEIIKQVQAMKALQDLESVPPQTDPVPTPPTPSTKSASVDDRLTRIEQLLTQQNGQKKVQRLPFQPAEEADPQSELNWDDASIGAKTWYIRKFGEPDAAAKQIAHELYGAPYEQVRYEKEHAFKQWARTGHCDPRMMGLIVYTPEQLLEAAVFEVETGALKATQVEVVDTLGGFAVPEDFRTQVIERLPGLTVIRSLARVMPTSRDVLSMVKRTGGNSRYIGNSRVVWVDETPSSASVSETNTTFGKVSIPVHTVMANVPLSRSFLEDSAIDPVAYIREELVVAMAIDEDEQFLVGNGAGRPQGILSGTVANAAPFDSDIVQVAGGAAATITADALVATPMQLDAQYRSSPACTWIANKSTWQAVYQLKDADDRYLWRSHNFNLSTPYPKELQGYSVRESEAMPSITNNTYPFIFGDVGRGYTIADRVGMTLERYQDSNTVDKDSVIFYARRRLGGQVTAGWALAVIKIATSI